MTLRPTHFWPRRIRSWKRFNKHIANGSQPLLRELHRFPDSVLVAGCQRSGTTAVTRIIRNSGSFATFHITRDDELDAALILSGEQPYESAERQCFQTTYVNDCYEEYFQPDGNFRLVWVIRNPFSVVYSMVYHWQADALNDLFDKCGARVAVENESTSGKERSPAHYSSLEKACFSYVGKSLQLGEISARLPGNRLLVIDYDQMCKGPARTLRTVFNFIDVPFERRLVDAIHSSSVDKRKNLTERETTIVSRLCLDAYKQLASYVDP